MQAFYKGRVNDGKGAKLFSFWGNSMVDYKPDDLIFVELTEEELEILKERWEPDGPKVFQIVKAAPTFSSPMRLNEFFYDEAKAKKYCEEHAKEWYQYEQIKFKD